MTVRWYNKATRQMEDYNPPPRPEAPFHIWGAFTEYRAVGIDNSIVTTRTDHKNLLKQHGMIEVGNEQHSSVKDNKEHREEGNVNV